MNEMGFRKLTEPSLAHRAALLDVIDTYSDARAGARDWPEHSLCLLLRDAAGAATGGLWGRFYYDWLFVELLFVPEERRGEGLGEALLAMAEAEARAWGAVGVWLDTFSFQARGFYEKKGYTVFGEIGDYPTPHQRFFLSRRLDPTGPARVSHPGIELIPRPAAELRQAIEVPLSHFNDAAIARGVWPAEALCLGIEDEAGRLVGGLWGESYYRWLHVQLLVVPVAQRRAGLGTALLAEAEAEARRLGCVGVWLDTFTFQAPDFYPALGYQNFGEIADYPAPHARRFFAKRLHQSA